MDIRIKTLMDLGVLAPGPVKEDEVPEDSVQFEAIQAMNEYEQRISEGGSRRTFFDTIVVLEIGPSIRILNPWRASTSRERAKADAESGSLLKPSEFPYTYYYKNAEVHFEVMHIKVPEGFGASNVSGQELAGAEWQMIYWLIADRFDVSKTNRFGWRDMTATPPKGFTIKDKRIIRETT